MTQPTEEELRQIWERFATQDPLWAIVSDPAERGRRWNLERFFETGRREVSVLIQLLRQLHPELPHTAVLDFGCGVGRLSQALANDFTDVVGVDVSPTMIRIAQRLNRHGPRVRYVWNQNNDLSLFGDGSFDLVYSNIVLQHVRPDRSIVYIKEFIRVLRPGSMAVFQLPSHRRPVADQRRPELMPPESYNAVVSIDCGSLQLRPSESVSLIANVRHAGTTPWRSTGDNVIRLGNHWLSGDGSTMLVQDDGRTSLPSEVTPGETVRIPIRVAAPDKPGRYVCEFDLVHEGIAWFRDKGSSGTRIGVTVGQTAGSEVTPVADDDAKPIHADIYSDLPSLDDSLPEFPMFGVPRETVASTIADAGAEIVLADVDEHGGPEWVGYRYFVSKPARASTVVSRKSSVISP